MGEFGFFSYFWFCSTTNIRHLADVLKMKILAINNNSRKLKMTPSKMPNAAYSKRCTQFDK